MASYRGRGKDQLGSYPIFNVVFSTTLALLIVGLVGLLVLHAARLANFIKENVTIEVYLNKNISESKFLQLSQLLSKQAYVLRKNGYAQLKFVSKEEAAQTFTQETGEDLLQVLDENPLRDVYLVGIAPSYQDPTKLQAIKGELEAMDGVFEVDYVEGFVVSIHRNLVQVGTILAIFAIVLLVVASILINSTIKLAVYSQRFLIRSMNLVGATAAFVRRPFLARALLIGLIAGTAANTLLLLLLYYANKHIEALVKLQEPLFVFALLGLVLVLGVLISCVGAYRATSKYLNMPLDSLY